MKNIENIPEERKFKKVGETNLIDNIIDYVTDKISYDTGTPPIIENNTIIQPGNPSNITISIGCDSDDHGRFFDYAITIVIYNDWMRNGAHFVYKKLKLPKSMVIKGEKLNQWIKEPIDPIYYKKIPTNLYTLVYNKLMNEAKYVLETALYIDEGLQGKYYIEHERNEYDGSKPYRLPVIHVDFNPDEGDGRKNKSNDVYHTMMGEFCGAGFKVVCKPTAYASTAAADFIVSKKKR